VGIRLLRFDACENSRRSKGGGSESACQMDTVVEKQCVWKSRDAWFCVLTLIVLQFVLLFWLRFAARCSPAFDHWWAMPFGKGVVYIVFDVLWLSAALWFSHVEDAREFFEPAGLRRGITLLGWCAALLAVAIAVIDIYGASKGLTASSRHVPHDDYGTFSVWCYFTLSAVLISPFCEEVATRGFLFRAFRGRFGFLTTTAIILCFSAYFHWSSVSRSLFTFGCLASLWVLLCFVREKTGSLWDCLFCHAVYNLVVSGLWIPATIMLITFLPFIVRRFLSKRQETILAAPNRDA
jgi:membrane protease YdiL (CAAX protease family)